MSKQALQQAAFSASGISFEESLAATSMEPSLFERIGEEGIRELSTRFYDKVFADKDNPWFLNIFSSSTRAEAIENQFLFFVQTFGGPPLYQAKKGKYTRLAGRHANYVSSCQTSPVPSYVHRYMYHPHECPRLRYACQPIGPRAAHRWVAHMKDALHEHTSLSQDTHVREILERYFAYTAHYIVAAMEYLRPDQVSCFRRPPREGSFSCSGVLFGISQLRAAGLLTAQLSGGTEVDTGRIW
jgi:truncated hemoglobin YjbI